MRIFCGMLLFWVTIQTSYGQRIYADSQQSSATPLLASVSNQTRATDLPDTSNFSTLNVTLGAVGLIYARQNLQFVNNPKPGKYSPIIAKIGSNSSLLSLLGGFAVQRTNGGISTVVAPAYSGSELLNLLNLFGGNTVGNIVFLPNGNDFDGIRFEVNSLLAAAITARYYYAFYIAAPVLSQSDITLCQNVTPSITISNFQSGYTYKVYNAQLGGTQIGADITTNSFAIPGNWEGTYWLEAREHNVYPSARTEIKVTRNLISSGTIAGNQTICEGESPLQLLGSLPETTTTGATITYQWQQKVLGTYTDIVGATGQDYSPPILTGTVMYRRVAKSTLNAVTCIAESNEITITVIPTPGKPHLTIKDIIN